MSAEFTPLGQDASFLGHVGGITWHRRDDRTDVRLEVATHHLNPNGHAHGGVLFTLMDITLGATVESFLGENPAGHPITVQLSSSLMGSARQGQTILGEARVESSTRTLTFVDGRLTADDGRLLMTARAVFRNPPRA
ncbi:PaaI family thioesterase [Microbacterium sp. RD1]|uniref:PaaI family thioesterase n=1 Tax=Microbacterium sp. RD1 TaxID=3457313 RepID=UPI003FA57A0E